MPLALENRSGAFVVIDMKNQECFSTGAYQQRIAEEEIHLRHEQAAEDMTEIGGSLGELDHEHRGLAEGDIVLVEQFGNQRGVADDHPGDGGLGGVDDAEGKDDDSLLLEELHHLEKRTYLVIEKDRKVPYWGACDALLGRRGWMSHG